ncbi:MAG TPA: hypothetical protein VMR97_07960 [Acidimicrobiales bacterium]|nr:hypothetical protein [Acidimicrobiales bacterium]
MDISPADLRAEVERALEDWPFIVTIERACGLPRWLLFAVGSRETNLTNEVGDGGHGHGVWQLDDRSHKIPTGFDQNVSQQAIAAAEMLAGELAAYGGDIIEAAAVYNSGQPQDQFTTGGDYGTDVALRRAWCDLNLAYPDDVIYLDDLKAEVPMSVFKSDTDAMNYMVRQWYVTRLGREPESPQVRDAWVAQIEASGVDAAFSSFMTTPEAELDLTKIP